MFMLFQRIAEYRKAQNWSALTLEFLIVVFGIFIGLQANNWNESRKSRAEEYALLSALFADFETAAQHLAEVQSNHQRVADAGQAIISYGETGNVPDDERATFEKLISRHGARFVFFPPMGTIESILGTNRIELVTNQRLLTELTKWPQLVARLNKIEIDAANHFHERLFPYIASRLDFKDLDKSFSECCFNNPETGETGVNEMYYPWDQRATNAYTLVNDQEFLNLIYWQWVHSLNRLVQLRIVEESLTTIRALLEEELAG